MKTEDLKGQKFHNWEVLGDRVVKKRKSYWKCRCDCGTEKEVLAADLKAGKSKRCFQCGLDKSNASARSCPLTQTFWHKFNHNADRRGLKVSITKKQAYDLYLKQDKRCAYTRLELKFDTLTNMTDGTASIDRIDSSKPYTKENIQWVHKKVNTIKMDLAEQDFLFLCHCVAENNDKPESLSDGVKPKNNKYHNKRDLCECGNQKLKTSKKCKNCYTS